MLVVAFRMGVAARQIPMHQQAPQVEIMRGLLVFDASQHPVSDRSGAGFHAAGLPAGLQDQSVVS